MEKKTARVLLRLLYLAVGLLAGWAFFRWGLGWVLPFVVAMLAAGLLERPVLTLCTRLKAPRWAASAVCVLAFYGALSVIVYLLASRLIIEAGGLLKQLPEWMAGLPDSLERLVRRIREMIGAAPAGLREFLNNSLDRVIAEGITVPQSVYVMLGGWVTGAAGALPGLLLFVVTCVLSTYFISSDYPRVMAFLIRQFPEAWREKARRAKGHVRATMGKWLRAQALLVLLTFVQLCLGLLLLGVPYPLTAAALVALVDALPVLGLGAVLLPWAMGALLSGDAGLALGLVVLYAVCSLTRGLTEPKLVGAQIGLPPIVAMLAMYVGFRIFGVLGMILFPVLAVALKQMQEWGYIRIYKT